MATFPDFQNELHYPDFDGLPFEYCQDTRYYSENGVPTTHWCFLSEIQTNVPFFPNQFYVKDKNGSEYLVAFHLKDRARYPAVGVKCKDGHTMCIMYPQKHLFLDGQLGVRVENERTVKILPCSLNELFNIRDKVKNNIGLCNLCGGIATLKCSRCKMFYCNKTCQVADWKSIHKTECNVVQQIVKWGVLDWDHFDGAELFGT
ncbi:hypothetical protein DFH07DRAFT_812512 [Mycena maculata]|uniref:MYND-type domain-containing protein n=1 Tax=Mycena maculata TaxID=230809 RepID=A0AAD7NJD8_9AGAR|nr:hypothetical protein DFH07DRAFT_812512 [Mycena maculata]